MAQWGKADNEGYSIDKFYTKSTDGRGHQKHVRVNAPPALVARASKMVKAEALPYNTVQDLVRDALHHRVHWLEKNVSNIEVDQDLVAVLRLQERIDYIRTEGETLEQLVDTLEESLELHYQRKNRKLLWTTIGEAERGLDAISPPYKGQVRELVSEYKEKAEELGGG